MIGAVLALAVMTTPAGLQQAHYRLTARDTLRYHELTESHVVLHLPKDSVVITTLHDVTIALAAERGDTATAWYEQLTLTGAIPDGATRTNTDGALHLPFRLVVAPRGQTTLVAAPAFPAEVAAQTDLSHQFEDYFITLPRAPLRPNATWADTIENSHAGSPRDTYQSRHVRRYRVLRDTALAGGVAAIVIAVGQEMTVRRTSPLATQPVTVLTQLQGTEEGTAVFAPTTGRLMLRVRRGHLEGQQTLQGQDRQMVVPIKYEYSSNLALLP